METARWSADALSLGAAVHCADGPAGQLEQVLVEAATGAARALVVRTGRVFQTRRLVPPSWVTVASANAVTLGVTRAELSRRPEHRSDREIRADVRAGLVAAGLVHERALRGVRVDVSEGAVTLTGHVRSRLTALRVLDIARRVRGTGLIVDRLVADDELEAAVARAVEGGRLNRGARPGIRADLGDVRVVGAFPSPEAREEAMRLAAGVEGVLAMTG
jgi:osmotically-inducible protein OsmY